MAERTRTILFVAFLLLISLLKSTQFSKLNQALSKHTAWKLVLFGFTTQYIISNFLLIVGFGPRSLPEHHYHPDFRKLRQFLTALDAGIVSCLHVRPIWLRDIISLSLAPYFFIFPSKAEDRMHRFHQSCTIEGIRACWEKGRNPILWRITQLKQRTKIAIHRRRIYIKRRNENSTIECCLYFQGSEEELSRAKHLVINYPGGGFICMNSTHHESYIRKWANYLHIPILSVNYRKAPEYKYPAAFNDAYDVYYNIIKSNGNIIKMNLNNNKIKVALTGDSAGGNLVATVCCRAIAEEIQIPSGIMMAYPILDFNISLFRSNDSQHDFNHNLTNSITCYSNLPKSTKLNEQLLDSENSPLYKYLKNSDIERLFAQEKEQNINSNNNKIKNPNEFKDYIMFGNKNDLFYPNAGNNNNNNNPLMQHPTLPSSQNPKIHIGAMERLMRKNGPFTSRIMNFDDGVLPIKYTIVIASAYLPIHADPVNDMYLSPIRAPIDILKQFPTTLIHVGDCDPLVDDSRRFVKRLKHINPDINVKLLEWEGCSHAYIQSPTFLLSQSRYSCELAVEWLSQMLDIPIYDRQSFKFPLLKQNDFNASKTRSKL